METVQKILLAIGEFVLFIAVSLIFLPAFLIVTYLQGYWTKKLGDLFGL